jgi:hypothetical protein
VFAIVSAATVAMQRLNTHVSTIEVKMYSMWAVRRLYDEFQMKTVSVRVFSSVGARDSSVHARSPRVRTSRQVTGLQMCVISCEVNNCSSAKGRPNKQIVK